MSILIQYVFWYYLVAPGSIVKIARNYIVSTWHRFYIVNHLKTLFVPWHRLNVEVSLKTLGEKIVLGIANKIADLYLLLVAAVVRLLVVTIGLVAELVIFAIFSLFLIFWIAGPIIFFGLIILGTTQIQTTGSLIYLLIAFLMFTATLIIFNKSFYVRPRQIDLEGSEGQKTLISYNAYKILSEMGFSQYLAGALVKDRDLKFIFSRIGTSSDYIKKAVSEINPEELKSGGFILEANAVRQKHGHPEITSEDIFTVLASRAPLSAQLLKLSMESEDIDNVGAWSERNKFIRVRRGKFWELKNLLRKKPIGQSWAYGYTPLLNKFTIDPLLGAPKVGPLIGRQREIGEIERILSKSGENNVLLIGEPGVGKESIILGFSVLVASGKTLPDLDYKRVLKLKISDVVSRFKDVANIGDGLTKILSETEKAGNIILIIENLHNFVGATEIGIGRVDVSQILIPYLASSRFQVIATTDPVNFHKYIANRSDLTKLLSRVNIDEPSLKDTLVIVGESVASVEKESGLFFTFQAVKSIVHLADKYIQTAPFPEKALDLLAEITAFAKSNKLKIIKEEHIQALVTQIAQIPIGISSETEKNLLLNLEEILHRSLINQDEAVKSIAEALRRARAGITSRHKPIGSFIFVGPTGVGKTETAKVLAKQYFGSADRIIRFDMAEYQDRAAVERFIGSIKDDEPGQFVSAVRDNPFSLILLDEIEKADKHILDLFLTVLDEGYLADVYGRKVNMEQTIIIATSNAGSEMIREMINQNIDFKNEKEKIIDYLLRGGYFSPEFLNRFDAIVIYHPLSKENLIKIAELLLNSLIDRLLEQGYLVEFSDGVKELIVERGFDPQFGARPMKRVIQESIEGPISKIIIDGRLKKGEKFIFNRADIS